MICEWDTAQYLIFSGNGEPLIYYSHLTSIVIFAALLALTFIPRQGWPKISFRIMAIAYIAWLFCDLVLWANENPDHVMFFWTLINLIEPLIFVSAYTYFIQFLYRRPLSKGKMWILFALLFPTLIMAPIGLSVFGFDHSTCDRNAIESVAAYYNYFLEALFLLLIVFHTIAALLGGTFRAQKSKLILTASSVSLLLLSFLTANFLGTFTGDYVTSQYGHIAVPIFAALLAYITIKYESFEPKILLIDALVVALLILLSSLLFAENGNYQIYANIMAFIIAIPLGYTLATGIRKEVRIRKELEILTRNLEQINEQQEGLLHFIGHEVKGFLTKDAGVFASLSEGDLGALPDTQKTFVNRALAETRQGVGSVENILKASNLKKGMVSYTKAPFDLKTVAAEAVEKAKPLAQMRGLTLSFTADDASYQMTGDKAQIGDHVLRNLIDNAVNYTPSGSINVSLKREGNKLVFAVKDTGIGISEEDKKRLFTEGGYGKDSQKVNVHSTGYGLFIAKQITEEHGGTIRAESEGQGKGSTFIVEFPV